MANKWMIDADTIASINDFEASQLVETEQIKYFLENNSPIRAILAADGFGKTFLLTAKRARLQDLGYTMIPRSRICDTFFSAHPSISHRLISSLRDTSIWNALWKGALVISILLNSNREIKTPEHHYWSQFNKAKNPSETLNVLLSILLNNNRNFASLYNFLSTHILPQFSSTHFAAAVFIDRIDEGIIKLSQNKTTKRSHMDVWYSAQIGLLEAIFELHHQNPSVKIFAGLRSEILIELPQRSSLTIQLKDHFMELCYERHHLKNMFMKSIQATAKSQLIKPELKNSNPLSSFLGIENIYNHVANTNEDAFDYLLRHTLRRPRDIMSIGWSISKLFTDGHKCNMCNDKTQNIITDEIYKWALYQMQLYIQKELHPFHNIDLPKLAQQIERNILTASDILSATSQYENSTGILDDPFLILYKCGLLGIDKSTSHSTDTPKQFFLYPGEYIKEDLNGLPNSYFYYIHPILSEYIIRHSPAFSFIKGIIVGHGNDSAEAIRKERRSISKIEALEIAHPKPHESASYRSEIEDIVSLFTGGESILDFGCGEAPLLACLASRGTELTTRILYIGIDKNTDKAESMSISKLYHEKFKEPPKFFKYPNGFTELDMTIRTHFIMVDTLHEMNLSDIRFTFNKILTKMNQNSQIILVETQKKIKHTYLDDQFFEDLFSSLKSHYDTFTILVPKSTPYYRTIVKRRVGKRNITSLPKDAFFTAFNSLRTRVIEIRDGYHVASEEYIHFDDILSDISSRVSL